MQGKPSDDAFGQHLLKMGLLTGAQLAAAFQVQVDRARRGESVPLGEILVGQKILTPGQRDNVEKKLAERQAGSMRLGPYLLLRKLGEGGMGAVYLAEEKTTRKQSAVKVLPKEAARNEDAVRRFLREVEAARTLDHPNIVRASGGGESRGYHYYVMEYVPGETLGARLKREEALAPDQATTMVLQVAHGLKYAHSQGFIHRDIKPENVIVTPEGIARILDMGLSKNLDDSQSFRTVTGVALGTPHYIAPEQARGDKGVDGRADIYSLGAMYYHLVTGETPFHGTTAGEVIAQHLSRQLPDPRDVRDGIPDGVVHVLRRMMAKAPGDRYGDCAALITDLELVLRGSSPSSQALEAARSAVGLPMEKRARERYRAERKKGVRGVVRTTVKTRPRSQSWLVAAAAASVLLALLVAVLTSGEEAPAGEVEVVTPAAKAPAPRPGENPRIVEARGKLDDLRALEKRGKFSAEEMRRCYAEFARAYADTVHGRVIADWLASSGSSAASAPATIRIDVPPREEVGKVDVPPVPEVKPPPAAVEPAPRVSRGLVGSWAFDEGAGDSTSDGSGLGHLGTIRGALWVPGRTGKALRFDGVDDLVEMVNTPALENVQEDGYSITAWFLPEPGGTQKDARGDLVYGILIKKGFHEGLSYDLARQRFQVQHWRGMSEEHNVHACSPDGSCPPGSFYAVAGVVDVAGRSVRLYVNGLLVAMQSWTGAPNAAEFGDLPWRIGCADPGGTYRWPAKGILDDVRLYDRVLTAEEVAASAAAAPVAERAGVPEAARLKEAEASFRNRYKPEQAASPAAKASLARDLISAASGDVDALLGYVMLREARELAFQAGEIECALEAVREMADRFEVNAVAEKTALLTRASPTKAGPAAARFAEACLWTMEEAVTASDYEAGVKLAARAEAMARQAADPALTATVRQRSREMTDLQKEWERLKPQFAALKSAPDAPGPHAAVGKFLCLMRGDWAEGLPLLAKGSDAALRKLAAMEAATSPAAAARVDLAEAWIALGESDAGPYRTAMRRRAAYWLDQAIPGLMGIARLGAEKRLKDLSVGPSTAGEVDLLRQFDLRRDILQGPWQLQDGVLLAPSKPSAQKPEQVPTIQISRVPPAEYDLVLEVALLEEGAGSSFDIGLASGEIQFKCVIDGGKPPKSFLCVLDGKALAAGNETAYDGMVLAKGRPTLIRCAVRKSGVTVTADGRPIIQWTGDYRRFTRKPAWRETADRRQLWISTGVPCRITRMTLTPLPAARTPARAAGVVPGDGDLLGRIPEARAYVLMYDLDLARLAKPVVYDVDRTSELRKPFDRVAYLMELQAPGGPLQYVYVSMDAFTDDARRTGIPEPGVLFQQKVGSMNIHSNVPGLATGTGLDGGSIEFWSNHYGKKNSARVPGASDQVFDSGDEPGPPVDGHGSMQVHHHAAGQTLFSLNGWKSSKHADLGIGNGPGEGKDWTFAKNAASYAVKRLRVLVRPRG